jgi:hypothetical protein
MRKTELDEFFVRAPRPEPHQFNLTDCVSRGAGACAAERVEDCPPPAHASPLAVRTFRSLSSNPPILITHCELDRHSIEVIADYLSATEAHC